MQLDFNQGRITVVVCPIDFRLGYCRLAAIASSSLNIDITKGEDWVIFISRNRNTAKIIHCDEHGSLLITRKLHEGLFQYLTAPVSGKAARTMDKETLIRYLDGEDIEVKRTSLVKG